MATRNEEQLLNELLRDLRESDERLDASNLEPRVIAAFARARSAVARPKHSSFGAPDTTYYMGFAAAAMIAFVLFTLRTTGVDPLPVVRPPQLRTAAANNPVEFPLELSVTKSPIRRQTIAQSSIIQSSIEFHASRAVERARTGRVVSDRPCADATSVARRADIAVRTSERVCRSRCVAGRGRHGARHPRLYQ